MEVFVIQADGSCRSFTGMPESAVREALDQENVGPYEVVDKPTYEAAMATLKATSMAAANS